MASRGTRSAANNNSSSAALRGALLIGVAVVLGAALLAQGFNDNGAPVSTSSNTSTTVKRSGATTTTAVPQPHDPATVKVLVLNGSGKSGIAKAGADQLKAANYTTLDPANATTGAPVAASIVYFTAGYDADAQQIAAKLGLNPSAAQPLPNPPPPEVGDPKDANIVVLIGTDAPVAGGAGAGTTTTVAAN
ncbi:MAG TPA: LytR C-terminal domain-containing protein [Acidimicrobiales bacterium]